MVTWRERTQEIGESMPRKSMNQSGGCFYNVRLDYSIYTMPARIHRHTHTPGFPWHRDADQLAMISWPLVGPLNNHFLLRSGGWFTLLQTDIKCLKSFDCGVKKHNQTLSSNIQCDTKLAEYLYLSVIELQSNSEVQGSVLPVRVVPTAEEGLTAISSHLRHAQSSLSIRLTPARDLTVWRRYLETQPSSLPAVVLPQLQLKPKWENDVGVQYRSNDDYYPLHLRS